MSVDSLRMSSCLVHLWQSDKGEHGHCRKHDSGNQHHHRWANVGAEEGDGSQPATAGRDERATSQKTDELKKIKSHMWVKILTTLPNQEYRQSGWCWSPPGPWRRRRRPWSWRSYQSCVETKTAVRTGAVRQEGKFNSGTVSLKSLVNGPEPAHVGAGREEDEPQESHAEVGGTATSAHPRQTANQIHG